MGLFDGHSLQPLISYTVHLTASEKRDTDFSFVVLWNELYLSEWVGPFGYPVLTAMLPKLEIHDPDAEKDTFTVEMNVSQTTRGLCSEVGSCVESGSPFAVKENSSSLAVSVWLLRIDPESPELFANAKEDCFLSYKVQLTAVGLETQRRQVLFLKVQLQLRQNRSRTESEPTCTENSAALKLCSLLLLVLVLLLSAGGLILLVGTSYQICLLRQRTDSLF